MPVTVISTMYKSIQIPWSILPSAAEKLYHEAGLQRTQGTVFLLPPSDEVLIETFKSPPRAKTRMSSGAVALCKHFERGGASSQHKIPHPFWPLPIGSNENKSQLAEQTLHQMLTSCVWKNMMLLHPGVGVYEIRNQLGYGMRWTVELTDISGDNTTIPNDKVDSDLSVQDRDWVIGEVTFRGFVEPIIGLDHELLVPVSYEGSSQHQAVAL